MYKSFGVYCDVRYTHSVPASSGRPTLYFWLRACVKLSYNCPIPTSSAEYHGMVTHSWKHTFKS